MERKKSRHIEERIFDLVASAKEMNFKIVLGHPAFPADDLQRVTPPIRPDEHPQLTFYVGQKAWDRFLVAYNLLDKQHSMLEGLVVEQYTPKTEEPPDAAQQGGG